MVHASAGQVAYFLHYIRVTGVEGVGSAKLFCLRELFVVEIDGNHAHCARSHRAHHTRQPDSAQSHNGHGFAGLDLGGVGDRAYARHDSAAKERRDFERDALVDFLHAAAREHGVFCEGGYAHEVRDRDSIFGKALCARQQRARHTGLRGGFAQHGPAFCARLAVAAAGHEEQDNVVADFQIVHALPQAFDHAGRFMAEDDRRGAWPVAVDDRQIGMAHARGGDAHQHFAGPGRCQIHLPDFHGLALRVGCGGTDLGQNCGACLHDAFTSLHVLLDSGRNALSPGTVLSTL